MKILSKSSYWAVLGAALFYAISLAFSWPNNVLSWDIFGYYLYLPSLFIYSDIGLEQVWLHEILATYQNSETLYQLVPGVEGKQVIKYPVGWAILNLPFFLIGHSWALLSDYSADGFSKPYQWSIAVGSYVYVVLGFVFLRKVLLNFIQKDWVVTLTLLILAFGTNLLHASVQATAMSHTYLFTLYAALIFLCQNDIETNKPSWKLGVVAGLLIVSRNSEIVLIPLLLLLFGWGNGSWYRIQTPFNRWKAFLIGFFPVVLIQMTYWLVTAKTPIFYSYSNPGEGFDWLQPHLLNFLFSFRKGWLLYTPVMLIALFGIGKLWKYDVKWGKAIAVFTVLNIYLLSTWTTWWYAASFGQRSMVQAYAVLAIPLAFGVQWLWIKNKVVMLVFLSACICLNLFQTWQYRIGVINESRMTQRAYIDHFLRTDPLGSEEEKKLLIHRSTSAKDQWPKDDEIYKTKHVLQSFESDSGISVHPEWKKKFASILGKQVKDKREWITDTVSYNGRRCFRLDNKMAFSPAIKIPFEDLTNLDYAWIEASAWVKSGIEPMDVSLVISFSHNGEAYHYRTADVTVTPEDNWKKLNIKYLTPEVRRTYDELTVYVWNRNEKLGWADDIVVQVYEDIYPVGQ